MNDEFRSRWRLIYTLRNIVLGGLVASLFFHWFQPNHYPNNTFLFKAEDRFADFLKWIDYAHYTLDSEWACPPFSLLLAAMWKGIATLGGPAVAFCLYAILGLGLHGGIVLHELGRWGKEPGLLTWTILSFLSYPVLFALDRGNPAWIVYLSLYGFFHFCRSGRYRTAAFFLAVAISIKIVPALLLFYLLYRGKWQAALLSCLEVILLNLAGYLVMSRFLYPAYSLDLFFTGLKNYQALYAIGDMGLGFSCCLHSVVVLAVYFYAWISNHLPVPVGWRVMALAFSNVVSVSLTLLVCGWAWVRRGTISEFKVSSLLILLLLLVPPVMADYYLLLGYLLFFDLLRLGVEAPGRKLYALCLGLVLIPKAYGWFFDDVNLGVLLNPLLLAMMLVCLLLPEEGGAKGESPATGEREESVP